jgi:hypothetical protein
MMMRPSKDLQPGNVVFPTISGLVWQSGLIIAIERTKKQRSWLGVLKAPALEIVHILDDRGRLWKCDADWFKKFTVRMSEP